MDMRTDKPDTLHSMQADWVVETKLIPPVPNQNNLVREQLTTTVRNAFNDFPVTLVSAPAGYGKTSLVSSAIFSQRDLVYSWLSLDSDDNDPTRFMADLIAAFHRTDPSLAKTAKHLITALLNPAAEANRLMGVLINDILASKIHPVMLVLDNLDVITEQAVLQILDYVIEHLPESLHLVFCTRKDPDISLPLLKARGKLAEFRVPELRFSSDEIAILYKQKHGIPLSPTSLDILDSQTEGWVAALQILITSLKRNSTIPEQDYFITHLSSSNRPVFDFLAEEVLKQQEPHIRQFLLETGLLSKLNPELCQAVTGQEKSAELLDRLHRQNLFLVALDEKHGIYRYHDLFAGFLQQRLDLEYSKEQLRELHKKAAKGLTGTGHSIRHYLKAELWKEAALEIEQVGKQAMFSGQFETTKRWIASLPEEVFLQQPQLIYMLGFCAFQQGEFGKAQDLTNKAIQGFEKAKNKAGKGEAILLAGSIASGLHDVESSRILMDDALSYPLSPYMKISAYINRAWVGVYSGDWSMVEQDVNKAIQLAFEMEDPRAFNMLAPHLTAVLLFIPEGVSRIREYCIRVLAFFGDEIGLAQTGALTLLGTIQFFQGKQKESHQSLEQARDISQKLGSFIWLDMNIDLLLLSHFLVKEDYLSFEQYWLEQLPSYENINGLREYLCSYLFVLGRALLLQGRLDEAQEVYERMVGLEKPQDIPESHLTRALMGAMMAMSTEQFYKAEGILRQIATMQRQVPYSILFGDARILLAQLYLAWNNPEQALTELKPALADYERLGMPGLLLIEAVSMRPLLRLAVEHNLPVITQQMLQILEGQQTNRPVFVSTTGETLSPREFEVLRLIVAGANNRDIASQLVISEPTVKSHVTSIFRKLNVKSRTQAVASARELRFL